MKTIIKSNYEDIPRFVDVMIGQRYRINKKGFIPEESFSGRLSELTIYSDALSASEIKSLASCDSISARSLVLNWFVSSYNVRGDVRIEDVSKNQLCAKSALAETALFNHGISHDYLKFMCEKLGGDLPTFGSSKEEKDEIYKQIKETFEQSVSNVTCTVSEDMNTDNGLRQVDVNLATSINVVVDQAQDLFFWTGIVQDEQEVFVNEYSNAPIAWDPNLYPGPVGNFSCTMARGKEYLVKKDCMQDFEPCGICNVESQKRLRLKGLCVDDLKKDSDFDTEFYAYGLFNERLYFRGIRASHIFYDPLDSKWTLQSLKNPSKISKIMTTKAHEYPIGRIEWTVKNNNTSFGICGLANDENHVLTFSDCHPEKYTCNTGQCIELGQKCDGLIDCQDGSDELECQFLVLDKNYSKDKLPLVQDNSNPVKVFFGITITAYPIIDAANSKITSDFDLNLKWYDPRLIFRDLKADETFNDLSQENKMIIWSPKVDVPNALGLTKGQLSDESTSIVLLKENEENLPEDFSLSRESRLYSGKKNAVLLTKKYSQEHACSFNLFYYPFDTQVCQMTFELRDKSEEFVQFEKEGKGISYIGNRNLADYQILLESLEITKSPSNHSSAIVTVVFRRQTGFHAITTFAQSMVLILVAFVTFFFNIRNFSDRIMVNLILLLILSTLGSTAQAVHFQSNCIMKS